MAKLVIVESPAKAKTIGKYLGSDYEVTASMGHIRDLPASQLGIDVEHGYTPQYISIKGKEKLIKELKSKAKHSDGVLLATDPDREGEAISWHLANILGLDPHEPNRVTFDTPLAQRNGVSWMTYELGSTFKPFLVAAALEEGVIRETDLFNCENGHYRIADRVFHEAQRKRHGTLSVHDILKYSSNIGSIKISEKLGKETFYQYIRKFGFGAKTFLVDAVDGQGANGVLGSNDGHAEKRHILVTLKGQTARAV